MTVSLVLVTSLNGKLTQAEKPSHFWASLEDQAYFNQLKQQADAIVMGAKTYLDAKAVMTLTPATLRVVLTSHPKEYEPETVIDQLEFWQSSPQETMKRLRARNKSHILVVGGAQVAVQFLQEKLITDVYLTIEPLIFARGLSWEGTNLAFVSQLKLQSVQQLNSQGTLGLHYLVGK